MDSNCALVCESDERGPNGWTIVAILALRYNTNAKIDLAKVLKNRKQCGAI